MQMVAYSSDPVNRRCAEKPMANLLAVCSQDNATCIACNTIFLILGRSVRSPQVTQAVEGDMISNSPASISAPMLPITRRLVACQRNNMIGSHVRHLLKVGGQAGPHTDKLQPEDAVVQHISNPALLLVPHCSIQLSVSDQALPFLHITSHYDKPAPCTAMQ